MLINCIILLFLQKEDEERGQVPEYHFWGEEGCANRNEKQTYEKTLEIR